MKEEIFCIKDDKKVEAIQVTGKEIYPHRPDLSSLKFYRCPICKNYVGTHRKSGKPFGSIPTPEVKVLRRKLHGIIDPLWKSREFKRKDLYKEISKIIKRDFHMAEVRSKKEADEILVAIDYILHDRGD